jgi:putative PIN family toxin of toxin-antitoxin system
VRVFLDTNVLVSAFATRGLCADVLRHVLAEHELIVAEVVLRELRKAMRVKLKLPAATIAAVEELLRESEVVPKPRAASDLEVRDPDDRWVLASAIAAHADVLVTGDRDLLDVAARSPVRIVDPRGFWTLQRKRPPS